MEHLFKYFLQKDEDYFAVEKLWKDTLMPLLEKNKAITQWLGTTAINGTKIKDGDPIFSAIYKNEHRALRIIQVEPKHESAFLKCWVENRLDDDDVELDTLTLVVELSEPVLQIVKKLVQQWFIELSNKDLFTQVYVDQMIRVKPKFTVNQRVSLVSSPMKRGRIDNILEPHGGHHYFEVQWDTGQLQVVAAHDLKEELVVRTPWDLLSNNALRDHRDFSIATTVHKVRNTTSNTISSLKASRTIFKPYQYKPLVKFLQSNQKRILVADEVGLGKTIEAGHIMLELAARGNLRNTLIICTKSLQDKWKFELQDKFNFTLKIYENTSEFIQDVQNDVNSYKTSIFGILNYEKCRNIDLQNVIEESGYKFDLLICDEAHKIRNSETAQHKGVAKIVDHSDAVVFLTATPIMTEIRNLHSLIRLLDRSGFDTFDVFNNAISQNKPFIRALNQLNSHTPLTTIAAELDSSEVVFEMTADEKVFSKQVQIIGQIHKEDPLYQRAHNRMIQDEDTIETRVQIQQDLIELNSLNHLYTRTRKKDVMSGADVVQRSPRTLSVTLSPNEKVIYDSVVNKYDDQNSLGLIQKKRQMSSCIAAFRATKEDLAKGIYDRDIPDSKFQAFQQILNEVVVHQNKKLIVFAFFTKTLLYLQCRLNELHIDSEIIYGDIEDRTNRIERFQHDDRCRILLSSEVGSEGLDLQFCDALVNYDLPWNPMVVEQRIGRIDRVGQRSKVINIYNLIIKDTIEELIYSRLYERINLFRESIGDLEEILGEEEPLGELITKGIESLYKKQLSEAEQKAELERIRMAIENNRLTLEEVRSKLEEAFANDMHFQNEIEAITKNNRYLTKQEVINYLESIIRIELSTLRISHIDSNISVIEMPNNDKTLLFDFIEKFKDGVSKNPELENLYRKFKKNLGARSIQITFDQQFAYEHRTIEYISAFHPLVNAITNYFSEKSLSQNLAHKLALQKERITEDKQISIGFYILTIYRIDITKHFGNDKDSHFHLLKAILADINGDSVEILGSEISEHIYSLVQLNSEQFKADLALDYEFVRSVRPKIALEITKNEEVIRRDEEIKFLSTIKRRTEQEVNYLDSRIQRAKDLIEEGKGIEAILKNDIEGFRQKRNQLLNDLKQARVVVEHSLVSVNLLQIL